MERQNFINAGAVGYIQGTLLGLLDLNEIKHEVKIDGMFGATTIEGLEIAVRTAWRVDLPPYVDTRTFTSDEDYHSGIEVFQKWYNHVCEYMIANHPKKAVHWTPGEIDGKWDDKTNTMFLIVMAPFSL